VTIATGVAAGCVLDLAKSVLRATLLGRKSVAESRRLMAMEKRNLVFMQERK